MKKRLYILLLIALPLTLIAAEGGIITKLVHYLNEFNKRNPQEKIYVQTDKTFYKQNEHIWYNAYLVNATDNKRSTISDVAYIELRDPKGNLISKHEHNVLEGTCDGEFFIKDDAPGGLYTITAYTNWMKNWGEKYFFKKEINVQKVITPRLLLKLEFEKRAYGPGDEVVATLNASDLRNAKANGSTVKSEVKIGGETIQTLDSKVTDGEVKIRFTLPADLNTSDGLLQIIVSDKGVQESISRSIPIVLNKISLNFFPEGGNLVANVKNKVAFEGLNEYGKGADVSGTIINDKNEIVASFESFHLGMGAFEFTPQADTKYFAKLSTPQNINTMYPLPEALSSGYMLNLKNKNEKSLTWNIFSPIKSTITLIGQTQGQIHYSKNLDLKQGDNSIEVNLKDFPIGVAVFTLFNENGDETCERLIFINPEKGLHIKLEADKQVYEPQEEVKLTVKTFDKNNKPVSAKLAISVVDEQLMTFADDKQDNLLSYLLFSSELKGNIQEPYFYFDPTQKKSKEAIDFLMLTHGWRRFTWEEVKQMKDNKILFPSEKVSDIYGYVLNKKGLPKQTDIYLIECGGRKRVVKTKTTREGQFVFHNVDLSGQVLIVTKLPNAVHLFGGKPQVTVESPYLDFTINDNKKVFEGIAKTSAIKDNRKSNVVTEQVIIPQFDDNFRDSDTLDEVVVVGYGAQQKRSMAAASISVVQRNETFTVPISIENILAGRVAGLSVQQQNINPQNDNKIMIRGTSTFGKGNAYPTIVLNGIVLPETINGTYNLMELVNITDIEHITISKSPTTSKLAGNTNNGIIYITTKTPYFRQRETKPKFSGKTVNKRQFYSVQSFSQSAHNPDKLSTTVYWNPNVNTDESGKATLSFTNNNTSSSFRITAEGLSQSSGLIGSIYEKIATTKPFALDVKTPIFTSLGDTVRLPIMLRNGTKKEMSAKVQLALPEALLAIGSSEKDVTVRPESTEMIYLSFSPTRVKGEHKYTITATAENEKDEITRPVTVRSIFFPQYKSYSGRKMEEVLNFEMGGSYVEGSFHAEAVCYTNTIDELLSGLESIFREPYGCFEQTSSSNFPNIMALQALDAGREDKAEIRAKALKYLESGYNRLKSYATKDGGYEWFGYSPGNAGLTAYGLLQFHEMKKVYDKVDGEMINRARNFVLSKKNGKGSFGNTSSYSGGIESVGNAYIIYALTETGDGKEVEKEYAVALREAFESKDLYRMALMANSAYNMKDLENHNKLIEHFKKNIPATGLKDIKAQSTVVYSSGYSVARETTALWTLAMLKSNKPENFKIIDQCIEYIASCRMNGSFGNTQATVLCLQAMARYANSGSKSFNKGKLIINSANDEHIELDLTKKVEADKLMSSDITKLISLKGNNVIRLNYEGLEKPLPYSINMYWEYMRPISSKNCPIVLTTKLNSNKVKRNEMVRLSISMHNTKTTSIPMNVAIIGIPGGMSLQPWQLKELKEKRVVDNYEIIDDNLVIYYTELKANQRKEINLDLKAEIPGTYKGMASSTYVYYTSEHKHWIDGLSVRITE